MPTKEDIRSRIIRIMRESEALPIAQRTVIQQIGQTYRAQAESELSSMLSDGVLVRLGLGKRGMPFTLIFGPNAIRLCPCCGQPIKLQELYRRDGNKLLPI